jgi:hypothetical protein
LWRNKDHDDHDDDHDDFFNDQAVLTAEPAAIGDIME